MRGRRPGRSGNPLRLDRDARAVPHLPVTLRFEYRVTTMDFTDAADLRFGGPVVGVMVRLRN